MGAVRTPPSHASVHAVQLDSLLSLAQSEATGVSNCAQTPSAASSAPAALDTLAVFACGVLVQVSAVGLQALAARRGGEVLAQTSAVIWMVFDTLATMSLVRLAVPPAYRNCAAGWGACCLCGAMLVSWYERPSAMLAYVYHPLLLLATVFPPSIRLPGATREGSSARERDLLARVLLLWLALYFLTSPLLSIVVMLGDALVRRFTSMPSTALLPLLLNIARSFASAVLRPVARALDSRCSRAEAAATAVRPRSAHSSEPLRAAPNPVFLLAAMLANGTVYLGAGTQLYANYPGTGQCAVLATSHIVQLWLKWGVRGSRALWQRASQTVRPRALRDLILSPALTFEEHAEGMHAEFIIDACVRAGLWVCYFCRRYLLHDFYMYSCYEMAAEAGMLEDGALAMGTCARVLSMATQWTWMAAAVDLVTSALIWRAVYADAPNSMAPPGLASLLRRRAGLAFAIFGFALCSLNFPLNDALVGRGASLAKKEVVPGLMPRVGPGPLLLSSIISE